ncbi:MAG: hypothetical protein B7Y06_13160 [Burkholderiales bacterium 24-55-52]|jgi:hypothetical protein|nr:MAG: hypothetical protein B7Y06_13160 [Burkholderiales bacterium 24-55-52]OZB48453.1 MAG: hypothetical protein B7X60_03955 [Polynucleobacter sp. 39-45-136]
MSYQEPLSQIAVAISISDSNDMSVLGLAEEHLRDAMAEIARYLLAMGARLVYGGDLRARGFTELLFELVARHRRDSDEGDNRLAVMSYLPWPVHSAKAAEELLSLASDLQGVAEIHYLDPQGGELMPQALQAEPVSAVKSEQWTSSLSSMRRVLTNASDARIVLGGRVLGFKGRMPGIAEEVLCSLEAAQPLFILGGFGGCARDIAEEIKLVAPRSFASDQWPGRDQFTSLDASVLRNGLNEDENATLARTVHVDEAIALILRGLLHIAAEAAAVAKT